MSVFSLPILRSDVLMFHSLHNQCVNSCFDTAKKLIFFNTLISETVCLLGLLNSR